MKNACLFVAACCFLASGADAADATGTIRLATDAREVAIPLPPSAQAAGEEQQYLALIEGLEERGDVAAPELVEPLTALGDLYFVRQDYDRAFETYASARQIMRVNSGFDTLPELPLIAKLVRTEEARGRFVEAWELEQSLVTLAERNAGRMETLPIFQELAEKRFALWRLHRNGVIPPQIELGCYYARRDYNASMGAIVLTADNPGRRERCSAGDRPVVQLALLLEARSYQIRALDALLQNGHYASDEFWDQFMQVLDTSYVVMPRARSYGDQPLANLMVRLLSYEPQDEAERVRRAMILVQLADMNVMRARRLDRYVGFDTVRQQYEQAYAALQQEGVSAEDLQALFAPELPITLPAFRANPLDTSASAGAAGYIDIAFEITRQGKSRRLAVGEMSANIERSQRRELERMITLTTFRPRLENGVLVENAPVSLRYYVGSALTPAATDCIDEDAEGCEF